MFLSHQQFNKTADNKGFTLLELAVVLTIIALITGMAISSGVSVMSVARQSSTQSKMADIDKALMSYRSTNNRLPCPASLSIAEGTTNFGVEGATPGTCTGGTPAATNSTSNSAEGAVPVVTLGLANDYAYDGWGRRIRYAVDTGATATNAFSSIATGCTNRAITVADGNGNNRTSGAIYALISNGENGHGAYSKKGVISSSNSANSAEQTNCHCTSTAAASTFAPSYIQKEATLNSTNILDSFDDVVTYKERWQIMTAWEKAAGCGLDMVVTSDWAGGSHPLYFFQPSGTTITSFTSTQTVGSTNPAYSPDGSVLLTAVAYGTAPVYSVGSDGHTLGTLLTTLSTTENDARNPVWSPDGTYVVTPNDTAGMGPWVYQYASGAFTKIATLTIPAADSGMNIAVDSGANHIAVGFSGSGSTTAVSPRIYKRSGTSFSELTSQPDVKFADTNVWDKTFVMFSPDGSYLYGLDSTDASKSFRIWTVSGDNFTLMTSQPVSQPADVGFAAVDPSNTYIAIASQYSNPYLIIYKRSGSSFSKLASIPQPNGAIQDMVFTQTGKYLMMIVPNSPYVQGYSINSSTDTFTLLSAPSTTPPSTVNYINAYR